MCFGCQCFGLTINTNYKSSYGSDEKRKFVGEGAPCLYGQLLFQSRSFWELHNKEVFSCGTCSKNRKNMPKAVTKAVLKKKGECVFRRDGPLLALKWWEKKKDVLMLSTIHKASFVETGKVDRRGNKIEKPEAVYYYCSRMGGGVDLSDQLLNYFTFLRKSTKWSRKLLIHLFNLVILNAYILNKHYG